MPDMVYRASILAFPGWIPPDDLQECGRSHPVCHPEPFDKAQAKASGRRICAQGDEATAPSDPSGDRALRPFDCAQGKLVEWGRMTNMGKPSVPIMPDIRHRASISTWVIPDVCHRESIWSLFRMDPRLLMAGMTTGMRSASPYARWNLPLSANWHLRVDILEPAGW